MKLFINEIIVDDRIRKHTANIKELVDDIKQNGQIQPITVRVDNSGSYRLVAGFRRLTAMKALGMDQIEAYVISEDDEEKLLQMEISENEVRQGFTRSERMDYIKRLEEIEAKKAKERQGERNIPQNSAESGDSRDKVANQIGISHDTIAREKKIIEHKEEIDPEDFKNWDEGKLSTNKVFKALQSRLRFLEAREKEEYEELTSLRQQKEQPAQIVEKVPDDYEKLKSQVEDFKHSEKVLRADKEKIAADRDKWERLYKESGRVEPTLDEQAKKDMDYLTVGINAFLRNYGSKAWSIDRRASIPEHYTKELQAQVRNLYAFAQNLYEITKGENE